MDRLSEASIPFVVQADEDSRNISPQKSIPRTTALLQRVATSRNLLSSSPPEPKIKRQTSSVFLLQSTPYNKSATSNQQMVLLVARMVNTSQILRSIYSRLNAHIENKNFHLSCNEQGLFQLSYSATKKPKEIVDDVYKVMKQALDQKIYHIIDDEGSFIGLNIIDKLVNHKFKVVTPTEIAKDLDFFFPQVFSPKIKGEAEIQEALMKLTLPLIDGLSVNKKMLALILQRLYPSKSGMLKVQKDQDGLIFDFIFPSKIFPVLYSLWGNTENLLDVLALVLKWDESHMPLSQKLRALNFLRTLVGSFFHLNDFVDGIHQERIERILFLGKELNDVACSLICNEIHESLKNLLPNMTSRRGDSVKPIFWNLLNLSSIPHKDFEEAVEAIAHDLKILASESISRSSFIKFAKKGIQPKIPPYQKYDNDLGKFFVSLFGKIKAESNAPDIFTDSKVRASAHNVFKFMVHLIGELIKIEDYYSSLALYSLLNTQEIQPFAKIMLPKHSKHLIDNPIIIEQPTWELVQEIDKIFCPFNNWSTLRSSIGQSKNPIPSIQLISSDLVHKLDQIKLRSNDETVVNLEELYGDGQVLLQIEGALNKALKSYRQEHTLKTDMNRFLSNLEVKRTLSVDIFS